VETFGLWGNYPTRIDEKGRLKIPVPFKRELETTYGEEGEFCVTSLDGLYARIYPMAEWTKIVEKVSRNLSFHETAEKFLDRTNYYGQIVQWDQQGRLLIPPVLRQVAEMKGEVAVLGNVTWLKVWNNQRFLSDISGNPWTPEDKRFLNELKI